MKTYKFTENNIVYNVEDDICGNKFWKLNNKLHRECGPASEYADGTQAWWENGELHRENGPAIEYIDGNKYWYKKGKRHREDGPAFESANGYKEYWYNDKYIKNINSDEGLKRYIKLLAIS